MCKCTHNISREQLDDEQKELQNDLKIMKTNVKELSHQSDELQLSRISSMDRFYTTSDNCSDCKSNESIATLGSSLSSIESNFETPSRQWPENQFDAFCVRMNIKPSDPNGGWNECDHAKFVTICQQYDHFPNVEMLSHLQMLLNSNNDNSNSNSNSNSNQRSYSIKQLKNHCEWYRLYLSHISNVKHEQRQEKQHRVQQIKKAHKQIMRQSTINRINKIETAKHNQFCEKLENLHQEMEKIHVLRMKQLQNQQSTQQLVSLLLLLYSFHL